MRSLAAALAFAALAFASPAHADDYTFTVPVRIENMRFVESANVNCGVYRDTPVATALSVGGRTAVPLVDHSFTGNVTVVVNLSSGYTRADATRWGCGLVYNWRMPDGSVFNRSLSSGERPREYQRYTGQTVASTVDSVGGPIAR
jgi:hypothetical protein